MIGSVMRRNLCALCMLAAWLCANGAALDLVQAFAWARMYAGYSRTATVGVAVKETFDPSNLCPICRAVQRSHERESRRPETAPQPGRITLLICQGVETALLRPAEPDWPETIAGFAPSWHPAVPLQPPRDQIA
jgi:hypothetical protein